MTLDDVQNEKPHPEPVQLALSKLGSDPHEAVMVGDNYHDILSGQAAGTKRQVLLGLLREEALLKHRPDFMLKKMSDLLAIVGAD